MARDSRPHSRRTDGSTECVVEADPEESALDAVVRGVTDVKGITISQLDPLYESVDVDALESLVEHAGDRDADVTASFAVAGCAVSVRSDGRVRIRAESS